MANTRKNVWELGGTWAEPILWYARGVQAMKSRTIDKPTSWNFYGAIHGFDQQLWKQFGYWSPTGPQPNSGDVKSYWQQCQHGSWYFLPWHRGYLLAFEANIRAAAGAPADWSLPYWNYFKPNENKLPPAFAQNQWPDGGNNPLYVPQRYGPKNDGNVYVPVNKVNLKAMNDPDFTGVASGGSPGFGGVDTGFQHAGNVHGGVETQPHDYVHGLVGGADPKNPQQPGLMSDPDTAGLDPIFWLHHANLDRLWEVWRQNPSSHADPTNRNWTAGPANVGERIFSMPMPNGTSFNYTPAQMGDLSKLGYTYDDLSPAAPVVRPEDRLLRLGATAAAVKATKGAAAVARKEKVELVGANQGTLSITGSEAQTTVKLDKAVQNKVASSLTSAAKGGAQARPDRVFLNLENVRGLADSTILDVYVDLPPGANPADHPERLAGSISLFGVRKATLANEKHAGQGVTFPLEITDIVDALHLSKKLDADTLDVRIVPENPVSEAAKISIGRVSIFRQGK